MSAGLRVSLLVNSAVPSGNSGVPGGTAAAVYWPGGICSFEAAASAWNAATLTLQYVNEESGTALTVGGSTTVTANAFVSPLYLPPGWYVPSVSGGAPTALNAALNRVPV
jgi:hypothetical protein